MIEENLYDLLKSLGFVKRDLTNRIIRCLDTSNEFIYINQDILFTTISYPPHENRGEHTHKELRITCVRSGRGILTFNNRKIKLSPGDISLLLPNVPHSLEVIGDSNLIISELVIDLSQ